MREETIFASGNAFESRSPSTDSRSEGRTVSEDPAARPPPAGRRSQSESRAGPAVQVARPGISSWRCLGASDTTQLSQRTLDSESESVQVGRPSPYVNLMAAVKRCRVIRRY
jgi:hypothetical protein